MRPFVSTLPLLIPMEFDAELRDMLRQLAEGQLESEDWLAWWNENAERVAKVLNRGQWLRLKPPKAGAWGPPCRSALVSQAEACALLDKWEVTYTLSDRYEIEWKIEFEEYCRAEEKKKQEKRKLFRAVLDALKSEYPNFTKYLRRKLSSIDHIEGGATPDEIEHWQATHSAVLPESYKRFLSHCKVLEIGDALRIGLPHTHVQEATSVIPDGSICFGEWWLKSDGDQLYFGIENAEPVVYYYAHSIPEMRAIGDSFQDWAETYPRCGRK